MQILPELNIQVKQSIINSIIPMDLKKALPIIYKKKKTIKLSKIKSEKISNIGSRYAICHLV